MHSAGQKNKSSGRLCCVELRAATCSWRKRESKPEPDHQLPAHGTEVLA
jgi:hypothetical protein